MNLEEIRREISILDSELLEVLSRRYGLALKAGEYKKGARLEIKDDSREKAVMAMAIEKGLGLGLPDAMVRDVYVAIINGCRRGQERERC